MRGGVAFLAGDVSEVWVAVVSSSEELDSMMVAAARKRS